MKPQKKRELFSILFTDLALAALLFVCIPITMVKGVSDWIWIGAMALCFLVVSLVGLQSVSCPTLLPLGVFIFTGVSLLCYLADGTLRQCVALFGLAQGPLDPIPVWLDALLLSLLFVAAQFVLWRVARRFKKGRHKAV